MLSSKGPVIDARAALVRGIEGSTVRNILRVSLILFSLAFLSACKTSEEKAEAFYQSGLTLLEAGDLDRAAIEFLNVFQHDGFHKDARQKLAELRLAQGDRAAAYSQYLRLIEQYPELYEVRFALAAIALDAGNWTEVRRHGQAAIAIVPDDPRALSLAVALAYRDATGNGDTAASEAAASGARALLDANPDDAVARRVIIDDLMRSDAPLDALPEIDRALQTQPESFAYHTARLQVLVQAEDMPRIGTQLERMVTLFPNDPELTQSLIGWYLAQDDLDGAEAYLRTLAGDVTGPVEGQIVVVQFLNRTQGPGAARQELDRLAAANAGTPNGGFYQTLAAAIRFQAGEQEAAIATFQDVLSTAQPSDQTRQIRNTYAQLLVATGDEAAAQAQVDLVLTEDAANVDALKLRAAWLIAQDRADQAILDLRQAIAQSPRDTEVLTLMAQAHQREGNRALAGERLALAADISGNAPAEAMRYANYLLADGRTAAARSVLTDARAANPDNLEVLALLARVLLSEGAWIEAQSIATHLRTLQSPAAQQAARSLQAALLLGQNRVDASLAVLQADIASDNADVDAISQVVQIHLQSGNLEAARSYLDQALADNPTNANLEMLHASLLAIAGDFDASEDVFRELIAAFPRAETPVLQLHNLLVSQGKSAPAAALIDAALVAQPASFALRGIRAQQLEELGDIDGAIAIYEDLYAADTNSVAIANNLASLIATYKDEPESISRAATIAKRLRELEVPQFQDTYGWIAYRQGNLEEARSYLQSAAAGLPDDPLVQYHLGMTYLDLGDNESAATLLRRALELAADSRLPQFDLAREKLRELGY